MNSLTLKVILVVVLMIGAFRVTASENRLGAIRDAVSRAASDGYHYQHAYLSIFEYGVCRGVEKETYQELVQVVSKDFEFVLANFNSCATNQLERLLVLNVCNQVDPDFFRKFVDRVADMAEQGLVTPQELQWTAISYGTPYEKYLVRTYRESKTRKLVEKLLRVEKLSNDYWKDILSGEAYWRYASQVADGLWKDPLVPVWDYPIVRIALATAGALIIVIIALFWYLKKRLRGSGRKERVVVIFCMVSFVALGQVKLSEDEMYVELKQATLFEHGDDRALAVEAIRKHSGKTREEWAKILIETSANWQNGFLMYDVRFYATKDNLPRLGEIINDTSKKNLVRMNAFTAYAMVDDYGEDSARIIRELRMKDEKDRVLNSCRSIIFYSFEENDCRRIRMEEALGFSKE